MRFLRSSVREIAGIFGVVLVLVLLATAASILATAGLGLIGFVPIVAVAVMPLQIAAWLVRGVVFQYLALTALGAYLTQYRHYLGGNALTAVPGQASRMINYDAFFSRAAGHMKASAIRKMGGVVAQGRDIVSFAPGFPAPDTFPWQDFQEIAQELLSGRDGSVLQYGPTRGYRPLLEAIAGIMARRGAPTSHTTGCSSRPARSRVSTSSRECCSIRMTSSSSSCRPTPARSRRFATCRPRWSACGRTPTASTSASSTTPATALRARGPSRAVAVPRAELSEPDGAADRPAASARRCSNGPSAATS